MGTTFVACSSDDEESVSSGCVPCALEAVNEVCPGENGNAFVMGIDTQQNFEEFVANFCEEQNPSTNYVTCAVYQMQGVTVPAQEVCEADNGNAVVNGVEGNVSFDTYITTMEMVTTCQ